MKKLVLIVALVLAFTACNDENTGWGGDKKPIIEEKGYLNIADNGLSVIFEQELGSAEIDPEQQSGTRAGEENTGTTQPEENPCADYWIEVLTEQGNPVTVDGTEDGIPIKFQYRDWLAEDKSGVPGYVEEPTDEDAENYNEYVRGLRGIKLPVGKYKLRACSKEEDLENLSYTPQYEGFSSVFAIEKGKQIENPVEVECRLAYVKVTVQFDEILASLIKADGTEVKVSFGVDDAENGLVPVTHTYVGPTRKNENNEWKFGKYTYSESNKDDNDLTKPSYPIYMLPKERVDNPLDLYLTTIYNGADINNQLLPVVPNAQKGEYRKITIKLEHGDEGQVYFVVEVKKLIYNQPVTVSVNEYLVKVGDSDGILTEGSIPDIIFDSPIYNLSKIVSIEDEMFDENGKFKGPLMTLKSKDPIEALYLTATSTNDKVEDIFDDLGLIVPEETTESTPATTEGATEEGSTTSKTGLPGVNIMLDVATAESPAGLKQDVKDGLDKLGIANGSEAFKTLASTGVKFSMAGLMELVHTKDYGGTYSFTFTPVVNGKTVTPITITVFLGAIVIDWPNHDMEKEYDSDGLSVKINVAAKYGIKDLNVTIKGALTASGDLEAMGIPSSFNLADPGDALAGTLEGLGFPVKDDVKGKTELSFDITQFMGMLDSFKGSSQFALEVVDVKGNKLEREIKVLVD